MSEFQTDLNHRERATVLRDVQAVYEEMGKLKLALERGNDTDLLVAYLICTLGWHSVRQQLDPVMKDAAEVAKARKSLDTFGGF